MWRSEASFTIFRGSGELSVVKEIMEILVWWWGQSVGVGTILINVTRYMIIRSYIINHQHVAQISARQNISRRAELYNQRLHIPCDNPNSQFEYLASAIGIHDFLWIQYGGIFAIFFPYFAAAAICNG